MALKTTVYNPRLHEDEETGNRVEKAWGNPVATFQCLREGHWEDRARLCRGAWQEDERQRSSTEIGEILTGHKGKHINHKDSQHWNKLPRKFACGTSFPGDFQLARPSLVSNLLWIQCWPCLGQETGLATSQGPFQSQRFNDSKFGLGKMTPEITIYGVFWLAVLHYENAGMGLAGYSMQWWGARGLVRKKYCLFLVEKKSQCQAFSSKDKTLKFQPLLQWLFIEAGVCPKEDNVEKTSSKYFFVKYGCFPVPDSTLNCSPLSPGAVQPFCLGRGERQEKEVETHLPPAGLALLLFSSQGTLLGCRGWSSCSPGLLCPLWLLIQRTIE